MEAMREGLGPSEPFCLFWLSTTFLVGEVSSGGSGGFDSPSHEDHVVVVVVNRRIGPCPPVVNPNLPHPLVMVMAVGADLVQRRHDFLEGRWEEGSNENEPPTLGSIISRERRGQRLIGSKGSPTESGSPNGIHGQPAEMGRKHNNVNFGIETPPLTC